MASLLDPKTRLFDTIFTVEGRRQASNGKMKVEFCSFTDGGTFYALSDVYASSSQDFIARLGLESTNLPQDQITFESDDSGKLVVKEITPFSSNFFSVLNGQVFSGSKGEIKTLVTGSEFTSATNEILSSSINNFKNLYILSAQEPFDDVYNDFLLSPKSIKFIITDQAPIPPKEQNGIQTGNLDHIESLFADKRFSHVPNYNFLPPVNKKRLGSNTKTPLGVFLRIGQQPIFEYSDLKQEIDKCEQQGFVQDVLFTESSRNNQVVCQFFEVATNQVTKLDVIDFGVFTLGNSETKQISEQQIQNAQEKGKTLVTKHVFFVGKLYVDSFGSNTFVNLFTLVWE
jgi:hypothetical protein